MPDAATALARLLARLVDDAGVIRVPGLLDDVPALSAAQRAALGALPCDEAAFRTDAGMLPGTRFTGEPERSLYERLWYRPSLAFTALEGMPLATAANQLIAEAQRAGRLAAGAGAGCRARGAPPRRVLRRDPPAGVQVGTRW